jgi:chromosome segregation ATPase
MATLTKSEELALFRKLVEAMPDGYVRDLLVEADEFIERDVRNDMCAGAITGLLAERAERKAELDAMEKRVADLKKEAADAERAVARANEALRETRVQFADLANYASRMAKP